MPLTWDLGLKTESKSALATLAFIESVFFPGSMGKQVRRSGTAKLHCPIAACRKLEVQSGIPVNFRTQEFDCESALCVSETESAGWCGTGSR